MVTSLPGKSSSPRAVDRVWVRSRVLAAVKPPWAFRTRAPTRVVWEEAVCSSVVGTVTASPWPVATSNQWTGLLSVCGLRPAPVSEASHVSVVNQ